MTTSSSHGSSPGSTPSRSRRRGPGHRDDVLDVLSEMLHGRADPGKMFGYPAFYAAGKLVACVYGSGVGVRLAPDEASRLRGAPARTFEPYGKRMREWTFIEPPEADDLRADAAVLAAAVRRAERDAAAR